MDRAEPSLASLIPSPSEANCVPIQQTALENQSQNETQKQLTTTLQNGSRL